MIRLGTLRDIGKRENEECWVIVRSLKNGTPRGAVRVPELSPSKPLFYSYLDAAKAGLYGPKWFQENYVPRFVAQMAGDMEARKLLDRLYRESREKDILLACFCTDETTCHRSIVGGLLLGAGASIECDADYARYFQMFREALAKANWTRRAMLPWKPGEHGRSDTNGKDGGNDGRPQDQTNRRRPGGQGTRRRNLPGVPGSCQEERVRRRTQADVPGRPDGHVAGIIQKGGRAMDKPTLKELIDETYGPGAELPGMSRIKLPATGQTELDEAYAFLGETPDAHVSFGKIMAAFPCCPEGEETRWFRVRFNVWKPRQDRSLANRLYDIEELSIASYQAGGETVYYLQPSSTDFGRRAFWMYTPDSEVGEDGRLLRTLARAMKRYSVDNKLCRRFRSKYRDMD